MAFEVFTREAAAAGGQAYISIQKQGIISLNRAAYVLLGEPEAVELLYDRSRSLVGVRGADSKVEHAVRVRMSTNGAAYLVSGARFTSHYGIPTDVGHRWPASMEGDVLCIDISAELVD